jgi:GNAT superfamily N-acetyltransferase
MYTLHTATLKEVELAVEWAAREGWNPGLSDARAFYAQDPSGFFVGKLHGEPVSCISCVRYPHDFAFIGFYMVSPEYRGKGYGLEIWNHAMQYGDGCTLGLDGVPAQQENYAKSGFHLAYRNVRYEYLRGSEGESIPEVPESFVSPEELPFEKLAAFDALHFGGERREFLGSWLALKKGRSLLAQRNGAIRGYITLRECRKGYKIGPLFAEHAPLAEALFLRVLEDIPRGTPIYLDVPEPNREALGLAEKYRMHPAFHTARMYRGAAPELPLEQIFGVTTFELG